MSTLPLGQRPIVMTHYPHMLDEDSAVWTKYLKDPVTLPKQVWYDIHVGKPVELDKDQPEYMKRVAAGLTRKRIDVIAQVGGGYWVIEVKPLAGYVALGQALLYRRLFIDEFKPAGQVFGVVVCFEVDPDAVDEYEANEIILITV